MLFRTQVSIPWGMLLGLLYHSAVFICSDSSSFTSAGNIFLRNPINSLLADDGSADLRSHGDLGGWVTRKQWSQAQVVVHWLPVQDNSKLMHWLCPVLDTPPTSVWYLLSCSSKKLFDLLEGPTLTFIVTDKVRASDDCISLQSIRIQCIGEYSELLVWFVGNFKVVVRMLLFNLYYGK